MSEIIVITPPSEEILVINPAAPQQTTTLVVDSSQGGARGPVGPEGPAGPAGPQGEPGLPGPSLAYVHTQNTPASTWTINHNLGIFPQVSIIEIGGANVEGEVIYLNNNSLTVSFTVAISGTAYIS